jgi:hypothetical protein
MLYHFGPEAIPNLAFSSDGFDRGVPLPTSLTIAHIRNSIEFVEEKAEELIELYFEQANIFSAVIGILGVRALDSLSPYKRHKHPDVAQQRFPDLSLKGRINPSASEALESKGSSRPWAIQSHYNHSGWYIVWRYAIDPTKRMKLGKSAIIWRVDVPFLREGNWKYEGSKASEGIGGRTHTFGIKNPAELIRKSIVYQTPSISLSGGKPCLVEIVVDKQ